MNLSVYNSLCILSYNEIVHLVDCHAPGMDKLKYYVLQADCFLKQLPKIDIVHASLASSYKSVMTDYSIYEIGDIVLHQRKLKMADKEIDTKDEYSEGDADDDGSIDNEDDDDNVDLPTSGDISLNNDERVILLGAFLLCGSSTDPNFCMIMLELGVYCPCILL